MRLKHLCIIKLDWIHIQALYKMSISNDNITREWEKRINRWVGFDS